MCLSNLISSSILKYLQLRWDRTIADRLNARTEHSIISVNLLDRSLFRRLLHKINVADFSQYFWPSLLVNISFIYVIV